jgi:hypothetical protein
VIFSKDSSIRRAVLFPNHYCWYVIGSSLDIFVTYVIIEHFHGREVNRLADALIQRQHTSFDIGRLAQCCEDARPRQVGIVDHAHIAVLRTVGMADQPVVIHR